MKITPKQAQILLDTYKAPFEALQTRIQGKNGAYEVITAGLIVNTTKTVTTNRQGRLTIIPALLSTLEAIVNGDSAIKHPSFPALKSPLSTDPSECFLSLHNLTIESENGKKASFLGETIDLFSKNESERKALYQFPKALSEALENSKAELAQDQFNLVMGEMSEKAEAKDIISGLISEMVDEVVEKAGDSKAAEAKPAPAPSNAAFYLECLSGLAMVAGGALCVAAMLTLKPLLLAAGMLLATIGTVGYLSTHRFFDSADSTKPTKPVAPESTVIEETADTAAATV